MSAFPIDTYKTGVNKDKFTGDLTHNADEGTPSLLRPPPTPAPLLGSPKERPQIAASGSTGLLVGSRLLPQLCRELDRLAVQNLPLGQKWPHEAQLTPTGHVHSQAKATVHISNKDPRRAAAAALQNTCLMQKSKCGRCSFHYGDLVGPGEKVYIDRGKVNIVNLYLRMSCVSGGGGGEGGDATELP